MFYNFPGAPANTGYQSQANPNPLTDPRNKIPGAFPNSFPMLPGEDPGAIRGVYGTPGQGQPQTRIPLAQGPAGAIGNMAGMQGVPLAFNGSVPTGNAGVDAKALSDFQSLLDQDIEARPWNNQRQQPQIPAGFIRSSFFNNK